MTDLQWLLLLFFTGSSFSRSILDKPPNEYWRCYGDCVDASSLFGQIRTALLSRREERPVFTSVEINWVDDLLLPTARVVVKAINASELASFVHAPTSFAVYNATSPSALKKEEQTFHLLVSRVPGRLTVSSRRASARLGSERTPIFLGVDAFLTANPCFIPLAEPYEYHGGGPSLQAWHASGPLLVLAALPHYPLHSTCVLFSALQRSQFPQTCNYSEDAMAKYLLPNNGFSSILVQMTDALVNSLGDTRKVLVAPVAEDFFSRRVNFSDPETGEARQQDDGWSWADPLTCPPAVYLHDPWACNFLSVSNCSDRFKTASLKKEPIHIWVTPGSFLRGLGLGQAKRAAWGDLPLAADEHWSQYRLAAWALRANSRMRMLVRQSMLRLYPLSSSSSASSSASSPIYDSADRHQHQPKHEGPSSVPVSVLDHCVAMHVRHNDAALDHRAGSGVDRSSHAHMQQALQLLRAVGTRKVFIATDNVTVLDTIASEYPSISFFSLRRPFSQRQGMFVQFVRAYDSKDNSNSNWPKVDFTVVLPGVPRGPGNNVTTNPALQESVDTTLSHVLAEWKLAAKCDALVAAFDSGFS